MLNFDIYLIFTRIRPFWKCVGFLFGMHLKIHCFSWLYIEDIWHANLTCCGASLCSGEHNLVISVCSYSKLDVIALLVNTSHLLEPIITRYDFQSTMEVILITLEATKVMILAIFELSWISPDFPFVQLLNELPLIMTSWGPRKWFLEIFELTWTLSGFIFGKIFT